MAAVLTNGGYKLTDTNTVTSINGKTGSIAAADIATVLTAAGYKLTDTDTNTWIAANSSQAGYVPKSVANKILRADGNGALYWGDDVDTNTWPTKLSQLSNDSGYITGITKSMVTTALGYTPPTSDTNTVTSINGKTGAIAASDIATVLTSAGYKLTDTDTNTWRPVQCNSTDIGSNTLNLVAGSNVTLSRSNGTITINSTYTDTNTWRPLGTTANTACAGNDSRLSNSRPASDVYAWAKAASKPSYSYSEISGTPSSLPASDVYSWAKASSKPSYIASEVMSISATSISANTSSSCSITGSGNSGKAQTIIYVNGGSADYTVTVPTTYKTPDGAAIELTCPKGGYCEVSYLNIGGTIYARGL